ncbi:MAG: Ig-like domain-containing protein, partial [Clostridia bacterium]|nr:Ig-like domain-containing protein [Clostridia bacterium]
NFNKLGSVFTDVYADYPSFNVFDKNGTKIYVAYNFENLPKYINFFDRNTNTYIGSLYVSSYTMVWSQNLEFKDNKPQIISINLKEGSTISATIDILINAQDDFGITKIELFIDDIKVNEWQGIVSTINYVYTLNTLLYSDGMHRIKAVIYDTSSQQTNLEVNVYFDNIIDNLNPYVKILQPQNGDIVMSDVYIVYYASDDIRLDKIEFYVNNILLESLSLTTTSITGSWLWKVDDFQEGSYVIKVLVYDSANQINYDEVNLTLLKQQTESESYDYILRNYPNPFWIEKEVTKIKFKTDKKYNDISLQIYDTSGKLVRELQILNLSENRYLSFWDGKDKFERFVQPGIYICRLKYGEKIFNRKIVALR